MVENILINLTYHIRELLKINNKINITQVIEKFGYLKENKIEEIIILEIKKKLKKNIRKYIRKNLKTYYIKYYKSDINIVIENLIIEYNNYLLYFIDRFFKEFEIDNSINIYIIENYENIKKKNFDFNLDNFLNEEDVRLLIFMYYLRDGCSNKIKNKLKIANINTNDSCIYRKLIFNKKYFFILVNIFGFYFIGKYILIPYDILENYINNISKDKTFDWYVISKYQYINEEFYLKYSKNLKEDYLKENETHLIKNIIY